MTTLNEAVAMHQRYIQKKNEASMIYKLSSLQKSQKHLRNQLCHILAASKKGQMTIFKAIQHSSDLEDILTVAIKEIEATWNMKRD